MSKNINSSQGYQTTSDAPPPRVVRPYQPNPFLDGGGWPGYPRSIEEVLGILAGAASTCWENPSGAGVFDSTRASELVAEAHRLIQGLMRNEINTFADTLGLGQVKPYGQED